MLTTATNMVQSSHQNFFVIFHRTTNLNTASIQQVVLSTIRGVRISFVFEGMGIPMQVSWCDVSAAGEDILDVGIFNRLG